MHTYVQECALYKHTYVAQNTTTELLTTATYVRILLIISFPASIINVVTIITVGIPVPKLLDGTMVTL